MGGMRGAWWLCAVALVGCSASETPVVSNDDPLDRPGPGRLVIVGGALNSRNNDVWGAVGDARDGSGPLCVVPTASAAPEESMASAVARLAQEVGAASATGILISEDDPAAASDPAVVASLEACSGFYFTGGSQSRIVNVFRPGGVDSPAAQVIRERIEDGAVLGGSSAGAAMMSDPMISGGGSDEAVVAGIAQATSGNGVQVRDGMGFSTVGFLDQHFLARGRWGRLLVAVAEDSRYDFGFGIDENTALIVEGDRAWVIGPSGVTFVDGRGAAVSADGIDGMRLTLFSQGDTIDLATGSITLSESKTSRAGAGTLAVPEDPFERWAFLGLLADFGFATETEVTMSSEDVSLVITKGHGFRAVSAEGEGVQGAPAGLSMGPFDVKLNR